jgi:polysaccharide biosynthesis protein PelE
MRTARRPSQRATIAEEVDLNAIDSEITDVDLPPAGGRDEGSRNTTMASRRPASLPVPGRHWLLAALAVELLIVGAALAWALDAAAVQPWLTLLIKAVGLKAAPAAPWAPFAGLLLAHASVVVLCLLGLRRMNQRRARTHQASDASTAPSQGDTTLWRLLALGLMALGPLGVAGALWSRALKRRFDQQGVAQDAAWLSVIGPGDTDAATLQPHDANVQRALTQRANVSPFADVMARGTPTQKQNAVAAIAANYRPAFARTLRTALNDREPTVRMMAAAATTRIENAFLDSSIALEGDWADQPDDAERALQLARHYDNYANTGLLDEGRATAARERALEMFELANERRPDNAVIGQAVIRLLVKLHREDEAIERFAPAMDADAVSPPLASWFLEALYRRREYQALRSYSASLQARDRDLDLLDSRSLHATQLWARNASNRRDIQPVDLVEAVDGGPTDPNRPNRPDHPNARNDDPTQPPPRVINVPYFAPRWA